jgi:predicted RNA-binding Zn-ribbon protein involved in translation (DUF1610 family)
MLKLKLGQIGAVHILDDRGTACRLVGPPESWPKCNWRGKPRQPIVDAAMSVEFDWATAAGGAFGALAGLSMMLTMSVSRWLLSSLPPIPGWLGSIAPAIMAGVLFRPAYLPVAEYHRRKKSAQLRQAYLKVGRCASCGYSLAGLSSEADGCVVCPECSRAWHTATGTESQPAQVHSVTR